MCNAHDAKPNTDPSTPFQLVKAGTALGESADFTVVYAVYREVEAG